MWKEEGSSDLHMDVAMTGSTLRAKCSKSSLGMSRIAGQGLVNLLIDDNVDMDTTLSCTLQHLVETPLLRVVRGSAQEEFGRQPPILNVDRLLCSFECDRDGMEVVAPIDVPLDLVSISFRCKTLESVAFGNL